MKLSINRKQSKNCKISLTPPPLHTFPKYFHVPLFIAKEQKNQMPFVSVADVLLKKSIVIE